jgi:hypothetical protein
MTNTEFQRDAVNATGCVSSGWELAKQNYGLFLGIAVVAFLIAVIPLVGLFLVGPLMVGLFGVYLRAMRQEPVEFGGLFSAFNNFVPAMAAGLVYVVPEIIFQIIRVSLRIGGMVAESGNSDSTDALAAGLSFLSLLLGLVYLVFMLCWRLAFIFVFPLMAERDIGPLDALKLSVNAALANVGGLIILVLIEAGIGLLGSLACCVGFFFVLPVIYAANAFAYRQVFPILNQPFAPPGPPPPPQYAGSYGQGL